MNKKPPSVVNFNFSEDIPAPNPQLTEQIVHEISDDSNPGTGEENPNFIYDDTVEAPIEEDEPIIKIEEKEQINRKELFETNDEPAPKPVKTSRGSFHSTPKGDAVKVKKPRKPMSEEHKAKLALAREKAMASRKVKAEERKKMKALDKEEKELVKQQKVKRVQKLKEEVSDEKPVETTIPTKTTGLTRKDLEEAQLEAIMKYEAIRKQRKEEKKQAKVIEEGKAKMLNQINRATGGVNYRYRDGSNRFDGCY